MKHTWWICAPILVMAGLATSGCNDDGDSGGATFPEFRDGNGNAINDYVEAGTHFVSLDDPRRHEYVDGNGDAVCDLAQRANPVWHGPGYIDTDGDGICDYWDTDSTRHQPGRRDIVHGIDFSDVEQRGGPHH